MRRSYRQRQPGQAIVLAALAMVAVVGGVAIAIDGGIFFVVQRQLQTAADAGALAGAWHDKVCPSAAQPCAKVNLTDSAIGEAQMVAQANADTIKQLCGGAIALPAVTVGTRPAGAGTVNTIVVTVTCSAGYSFGRILGLDRKLIQVSARAAIGDRDPITGDMAPFTTNPDCTLIPDKCRIARLID